MSTKTGAVRTTQRRLHAVATGAPLPTTELTESLPRLVEVLEASAEQSGWGNPPSLVRITASPSISITEGFDLGLKPVDDMSVVEALSGFVAPVDWLAIGVITEGNARHMVEHNAEPRRVRCVHVVDRSGASASTLRLQGDDATMLDGQKPEGRIDDACRRALGLATAPPGATSAEVWAAIWLDRVLAMTAGAEPGARTKWTAVAELHPAVSMVVHDSEANWQQKATDSIVRLGEILAEVQSWSVLRAACAAGKWPVDHVTPAIADWLDDGAFSRWVLGGFPPLPARMQAVAATTPPSVARRVRAALRGWNLAVE